MKQNRIFFDIETQANPENLALAPEPKAPGNLKDPANTAAAIAVEARALESLIEFIHANPYTAPNRPVNVREFHPAMQTGD